MTTAAKDSWTVETERMRVTIVSEKIPMPQMPKGMPTNMAWTQEQMPSLPKYLLITRPGREAEPIRIEGDDVQLLVWMLSKLSFPGRMGARHYQPMFPPGGDGGFIGEIG